MKKVLIIYKHLPQYRVDFFNQLKNQLADHNVELELIYGKSNKIDALRKDEAEIKWAKLIENKRFEIGKKVLIWQPCFNDLKGKDLVIVLPENKLILNYYLMISMYFAKYKVAYWGHTYSMHKDIKHWRNKAKLLFINRCNWWFVFTKGARKFLVGRKYPEDRITVVQNAIDTFSIKQRYKEISATELQSLKDQLGIVGDKIGLFCGAMYPGKNLDFILEACHLIKKGLPDFQMVLVGSGIESYKAVKAAESYDWIHYVGPKFGNDRVIYFKVASVQLMPKLVGLAIVDSFAMETPIITTINPFHGPEIDYLENGVNGVETADDVNEYSDAVVDLLKTGKYLDLIAGGLHSSEVYTVENMVGNFKNGILSCLNA